MPDNSVKRNARQQNELLHEIKMHRTKSNVRLICTLYIKGERGKGKIRKKIKIQLKIYSILPPDKDDGFNTM